MIESKNWSLPKKYTVAALLARSNMGQRMPDPAPAGKLRTPYVSLGSAIYGLCSPFMETDEHEGIFMEEGRMWLSMINKNELVGTNKDVADFYDASYRE